MDRCAAVGIGCRYEKEAGTSVKAVFYTQRVEIVESYGERRDCADQNIPRFLEACGYLPIPLPNARSIAEKMIEQIKPEGIVLTGGNSLVKYGGNAPERDEMEKRILGLAMEKDIPVYGFCRGMQVIVDYFGSELEQVQGHVAVRHAVSGELGIREVNSFHNQACCKVKLPLRVLAQSQDGVIEAVCYPEKHILATMWHPERENPFQDVDIQLVRKFFL